MKDSLKVANELVRIAKLMTGADNPVMKAIERLVDLSDDVDNFNTRTMSSDEYKAFMDDWQAAFKQTKTLKNWGKFRDAVYDMQEAYEGGDIDEDELNKDALESDFKILNAVLAKHGIYERMLHPARFLNRERDFEHDNRAYLAVIPKWLRPIMIENDISISEGLGGFFFSKGDDRNELSPDFEEIVDLIDWAKKNQSKLG